MSIFVHDWLHSPTLLAAFASVISSGPLACASHQRELPTGAPPVSSSGNRSGIDPGRQLPSSDAADASATKAASPFHLIGILEEEEDSPTLEVRLEGAGAQGFISAGRALFRLSEDGAEPSPAHDGLGPVRGQTAWEVGAIGGNWPGAAFAVTQTSVSAGTQAAIHRWNGSRWQWVSNTRPGWQVLSIGLGSQGSVLALVQRTIPDVKATIQKLAGPPGAVTPEITKQPRALGGVADKVQIFGFASLPTGQAFAAGNLWKIDDGAADTTLGAVERWAPGQKRGTIDVLPETSQRAFSLVGIAPLSASEVQVFGDVLDDGGDSKPYTAVFDGATWRVDVLPFSESLRHVWYSPGGVTWLGTSTAIWRRSASAPWTRIPLPADLPAQGGEGHPIEVESLWSPRAEDVWVVVRAKPRRYLLHTVATARPVWQLKLKSTP